MSKSLENIVGAMIADAPPGNDKNLINDIKTILNDSNSSKLISESLREYYLNKDFKLVKLNDSLFSIVSKYNQSGIKFIDYENGVKFDYDFDKLQVIDMEPLNDAIDSELGKLSNTLEVYAHEHFPSFFKSLVVPGDNGIYYLIIVDEKLNDANYYNGKWQSFYQWNSKNGELSGEVTVKIHYYEDGNVILNTKKTSKFDNVEVDDVVKKILQFEDDFEIGVLKKFTVLNEEKFKNLRRQLPISRSIRIF